MKYTKENARRTVLNCAKKYHQKLLNRKLLIVYREREDNLIHYIEVVFLKRNFQHLTGLELIDSKGNVLHNQSVNFFRKCIDNKLSVDELPQLINILKGEMSLIGPRPWIPEYYKYFSKEQKKRCDVLPGITGLAQAMGRNNLDIFEKINSDIKYTQNVSFKMDCMVIIETVKTVLSKTGAEIKQEGIQDEINMLKAQ